MGGGNKKNTSRRNKSIRRRRNYNKPAISKTPVTTPAKSPSPCDASSSRPQVNSKRTYVIKSPMDSKDYLVIELPNGLKAFLISTCDHEKNLGDKQINARTGAFVKVEEFNRGFVKIPDYDCKPQPKKPRQDEWSPVLKKARESFNVAKKDKSKGPSPASVCLTIGAGAIHDPEDIPGMAHICEHACASFGSKKYPQASKLFHETEKYNGMFNAFTIHDNTFYTIYIDLNASGVDGFESVLDVLTDHIQNPLLPAERVAREIHAVDCEFGLQEHHDTSRMWQILSGTSNTNIPFGRFICGNSESFRGKDLHKRIAEWKERHYASNYMTLTIKADLPLDQLEKIIEKCFSNLKKNPLPSPTDELLIQENPFDMNKFKKLYKIYPVTDLQLMVITWNLPTKFAQNVDTKPLTYLGSLFSDGSSLMKHLREKHWVYFMRACSPFNAAHSEFCSLFTLMIQLTDTGVRDFVQVLKAIYSYLKMIIDEKPQERIFVELQRDKANAFHYGKYCPLVASPIDLMELAPLTCSIRKLKDPKFILTSQTLMTEFDPKLIEECAKSLTPKNMNVMISSKTFRGVCKEVEPWYKTKYAVCDLPEDLMKNWENPKSCLKLQLPVPNKFRQQIIICPTGDQGKSGFGLTTVLLKNNKASAIYSKLRWCEPGNFPVGIYKILIANPTLSQNSIGSGLLEIWLSMIQDYLVDFFYQVKKSRVLAIGNSQGGNSVAFTLIGPPGNHSQILKTLLNTFNTFEKLADEGSFNDFKDLYSKACGNVTLSPDVYAMNLHDFVLKENHFLFDHTKAAIENSSFEDFQNFIRGFKSKMFVQAIMAGCVAEADAKQAAAVIEGMKYNELPKIFATPVSRAMQLPVGEHCIRVKSRNKLDEVSGVINLYQFDKLRKFEKHVLKYLASVMYPHAFVQLRNVENLSYVCQPRLSKHAGVLGLRFHVYPQAHRHTTGFVDERIDAFLVSFREKFGDYDEFFKGSGETPIYSREEHRMMLQIYDDYLLPNGKAFRKLSIQVVGNCDEARASEGPKKEIGLLSKIQKYQKSSSSGEDENSKIFPELDINYDVPEGCEDKNGYFITDIVAFKNSLFCYPCRR